MEIYITCFAGLLSCLLLAVVYLADRYEREPLELIQNSFLAGIFGQLLVIIVVVTVRGDGEWTGPWLLVTMVAAAVYLPFQLSRRTEMDERFDGIVYSVAFVVGTVCAIHLHNLPRVVAASPYRDSLEPGAAPDLRDMIIVATTSGFKNELGQGFVLVLGAVLVGAVLGTLQLAGWSSWRISGVCSAVGIGVVGLDLVVGGSWMYRAVLMVSAVMVAVAVKRRSVFRKSPQANEGDLLVLGVKTVLIVLGATLLATVLLLAAEDREVTVGADHRAQSDRSGWSR